MTHLSRFFRQRREARKLSFGELARQLAYTNIAKGSNRIVKFERDANIRPELLRKLAAVLEISADDIRRCVEADKIEWERWADEPIEPHLVARIIPAVYRGLCSGVEWRRSQIAKAALTADKSVKQ